MICIVATPLQSRPFSGSSVGSAVVTGLCATFFAVSGLALPAVVGFSALYAGGFFAGASAFDGVVGAYQSVKAYKKNNPLKPE